MSVRQAPPGMARYINYPEPQLGYVRLTNEQGPLMDTDKLLTQTPRPEVPYENDRAQNPSIRGALLILAAYGYVSPEGSASGSTDGVLMAG